MEISPAENLIEASPKVTITHQNESTPSNRSFKEFHQFNLIRVPKNIDHRNSNAHSSDATPYNFSNNSFSVPSFEGQITPVSKFQENMRQILNSGQETLSIDEFYRNVDSINSSNLSKYLSLNMLESSTPKNDEEIRLKKIICLLEYYKQRGNNSNNSNNTSNISSLSSFSNNQMASPKLTTNFEMNSTSLNQVNNFRNYMDGSPIPIVWNSCNNFSPILQGNNYSKFNPNSNLQNNGSNTNKNTFSVPRNTNVNNTSRNSFTDFMTFFHNKPQ